MNHTLREIAYLGCPYSHPDPKVRKFRERAVTQMVYDLRKQDMLVYSPLTHNCPVDRLGVYGDYQTWLDFDHGMLARCNRLLVLKLPGWEKSRGLEAEIAFAKSIKLPVMEIEPDDDFIKRVSTLEASEEALFQLLQKIQEMTEERDWSKFHAPKNLAMSLLIEAAEVAEHFNWISEEQSHHLSTGQKQAIADELGDVFINLLQLSDKLGIDLFSATQSKIEKIKQKYPVELAKGKVVKQALYQEVN